jgi:hypothetical protein
MKKITLLMLIALITSTTQAQNKLLSSTDEYYDGDLKAWVASYGSNYQYDSNNNVIEEISLSNSNGVWKNSYKDTYNYNANNKVTEAYGYQWNNLTNLFDLEWKTTYKYVNNRLTEMEELQWNGTAWESEEKSTVTYNNNLPNVITGRFLENGQWYEDRTTFTFNANNKLISEVVESLLGAQWVNKYKTLYTYNANNKLVLSREANWDDFNQEWKTNGEKDETEWDAVGNKTSETGYYNNTSNRREYTYETTMLMSSFAHPFKDKTGFDYFEERFPYVNKLLSETSNGGNSRTTYNYNSAITLSTKTNEIDSKKIAIYPNPTNATITVSEDINNLEVFDIAGKKVKAFPTPSTSFDVSNLKKGVYFLKGFSAEGGFINEKLIKD